MKIELHPLSPHLRVMAPSLLICLGFLVLFGAMPGAGVMAQEGPPFATPTPAPVPPPPPVDMPIPEPPFSDVDCQGSATISGTVVDKDGNPVTDVSIGIHAAIEASPDFPPGHFFWCDDAHVDQNGAFTTSGLAAGTYKLHFYPMSIDGSEGLFEPEPVTITVADGEAAQIADPIQMGGAQAFVELIGPFTQNQWIDGNVLLNLPNSDNGCDAHPYYGTEPIYARLSEDGHAYFGGAAPGSYCMSAEIYSEMMEQGSSATLWETPAPKLVTIPEDADMLDLGQIEFIAPPKRIVGSVVDESGAGVAGLRVEGWSDTYTSPPYLVGWINATTDADGNFTMTVYDGAWNLNINIDNTIGYSDDTSRMVTFAHNDSVEEQSVQFTIQRINSQLSGRLLRADGSPIGGEDDISMIWIEASSTDGTHHGSVTPNQDGSFTMPLMLATYRITVYVDQSMTPELFAPAPFKVTLNEGETLDVGDILLGAAQVTALIVEQDGTTPVSADYYVYATQDHDGDGVAGCNEQNDEGWDMPRPMPYDYGILGSGAISNYGSVPETGVMEIGGLPVGDYCAQITIHGDGSTYIPMIEETFSIDEDGTLIDLGTLAPAASIKQLSGRVVRADGSGVAGVYINGSSYSSYHGGWANTYTDAEGNFTFDLAAGEWEIYIDLYSAHYPEFDDPIFDPMYYDPNYGMSQRWFTDEEVKFVTFVDDDVEETQSVEFTVSEATSTITGTMLKPDGTPAIGINGEVQVHSVQPENSWIIGHINPETATYEVSVVGGEWQVGFNLYSYGYGDINSGYVEDGPQVVVTVADGSSTQQDFTLQAYDATIRGTVLNADGSPLAYGHAWVNSVQNDENPDAVTQYIHRYADIVDGTFEVMVLSGAEYEVGVSSFDHYGYDDTIQPDMQYITPQPESVNELTMQFAQPDAAIVGTVYITDTATVAANAEISAWSTNGQYRWTAADANGVFSLTVQSGSTWHVSAWWYDSSGYLPYHTNGEVEIVVAQAGQVTQDLDLMAEDYFIPQLVETLFEVNEAHSVTLDDGTVIEVPAGAVPVEDADGEDVRMVITPLTAGLPGSYATDAVDYGYNIQLYDQHSGEEVTASLNADIIITYQYEDAALAAMDADESTLAPVVRTTEGSAWDATDTFVVNPDKNEIRLSMGQASEAAMTVRPRRSDAPNDGGTTTLPSEQITDFNFLPLMFE